MVNKKNLVADIINDEWEEHTDDVRKNEFGQRPPPSETSGVKEKEKAREPKTTRLSRR